MTHHGCDRDRSQPKQEEDEHGGNQFSRGRWSAGKFFPDEDAPDGRYHRCTLADCVRDRRTDHLRVRCNKVEHRSRAPDRSAENSPPVPSGTAFPIVGHAHGRASGQRPPHEEVVYGDRTHSGAESKEKRHRVGTERALSCSGLRHKGIKRPISTPQARLI